MLYEKIALVILFLAALFAVQIFLYKRSKAAPLGMPALHNLKVLSRLNLSRNTQLNIVTAGSDTLLIISSKNAPATVTALNFPDKSNETERQQNEA